MKKKLSIIAVFLVAVMLGGLFAGCGGSEGANTPVTDKGTVAESTEPEKPVPLKIFRMANKLDPEKDPILLELQKRTNTKIEIVTAPWDQWVNKLNLVMSSAEEMDIIHVDDSSHPWTQWAEEGLMVNLDDHVKSKEDYPYMYSAMNSETFNAFAIDGKHYYLPGVNDGYDYSIYLRKDWLDNVGLQVPTTPDEFYNVMKAFTKNDPDKNSKDDTVGYVSQVVDGTMEDLIGLFGMFGGATYSWHNKLDVDSNGKVFDPNTSKESKNALVFLNRLYREGLINTDLASITDSSEKYIYTNKGGGTFFTGTGVSKALGILRESAPEADFVNIPPMQAPGAEFRALSGPVYWLLVGVPASSKNQEKAIEFIEYMNSQEGRELFLCGVKGRHYTELDAKTGLFDRNTENWVADYGEDDSVNPLWWGFTSTVYGYIPCKEYSTWEEAYNNKVIYTSDADQKDSFNRSVMINNGSKYMENKPFTLVKLPEVDDIKVKLNNDVLAVYYLKMIIEKDQSKLDALWDEFVSAYDKAGGKTYIEAFQKYYDEKLK